MLVKQNLPFRPWTIAIALMLLATTMLLCYRGPPSLGGNCSTRLSSQMPGTSGLVSRSSIPMATVGEYFLHDDRLLPRRANNFDDFLGEMKDSLDAFELQMRPVEAIFNSSYYYVDVPHPACTGTWLEFGVYNGGTINITADWRATHCGPEEAVYGFDTFTGLPEEWRSGFGRNAFTLDGKFPAVKENVELVQGLFSESLPKWVNTMDKKNRGRMPDASYIHFDMDLYAGAHDVFTLLESRIASGCLIIFDDLVNYPQYREHEVKAFWEFLVKTGRRVAVVGKMGPLPQKHAGIAMDIGTTTDYEWYYQSAAFIVL